MGLIPLRLRVSSEKLGEEYSNPISSNPPIKSTARRRRQGPVTDLIIRPYTQREWTKVMEEVKHIYTKRQYKQCSARCIQLLDNVKDPYRIHPLYSIYLSFYAASSLELMARSLHVNSSSKIPLFQQSLSYYAEAESRMEYATFSADPTIIQAARCRSSSISSSIRSSVDSVFSQSSSSALPSPTDSICELPSKMDPISQSYTMLSSISTCPSQQELSPAPLRIKKKVSFSPMVPTTPAEAARDYPTISDSDVLDAIPAPPCTPSNSPSLIVDPQPSAQPNPDPNTSFDADTDSEPCPFLPSRSMTRYRHSLSALHTQLAYHIESVKSQIHTIQTSCRVRGSNLLNTVTTDFGSGVMENVEKEEWKKVELKARIEGLKSAEWRRERFSGGRYQALAEKALEELE